MKISSELGADGTTGVALGVHTSNFSRTRTSTVMTVTPGKPTRGSDGDEH